MLIDIDNSKSVISAVKNIGIDWVEFDSIYHKIQSDQNVGLGNFWNITDEMIRVISEKIHCSPEEFKTDFSNRLVNQKVRLMGYHCTRHSNKESFIKKGILPLSSSTIQFPEKQDSSIVENTLEYRLNKGPGPYFCLSYDSAKNPNNHYCNFGAEILLGSSGKQENNDTSQSKPLIIHCSIPFSLLPDHEYYIFCILRAYFSFIDPSGETENLFYDYAIDLKNQVLPSKYILKIEEI